MDSKLLGILVVGGGTLLAVVGLLLVRRKFDFRPIGAHHEVGGYMFSIVGTLYSVVLGFMVVDVSNHMQEARVTIGAEVNALINIYRISDGFPEKNKVEFQDACISYARAVSEDEWDKMPRGGVSKRAWEAMFMLWNAVKHCQPVTPQEQCFYSALMENFDNMSANRRVRLVMARGRVSAVLWVVLVAGAIATISFTYLFSVDKLFSQVVMTMLVSLTLCLNFYLIVVNSNPFDGDFRIRPQIYQVAAKIMSLRGKIPEQLDEFQ